MSGMASSSTRIPIGSKAESLSKIYVQLNNAIGETNANGESPPWTIKRLDDMVGALNNWDATIEWLREDRAKDNPLSYFFYTLNRVLYNFVSMTFSNPSTHIKLPEFANNLKDVLEILSAINNRYQKIISAAQKEKDEKNIQAINDLWAEIYGTETSKQGLLGKLKLSMEFYRDNISPKPPELLPPVLENGGLFPYSDSIKVLNQQIDFIDEMNKVYWEWERQLQKMQYKKGQDGAAEILFTGQLPKNYLDKVNDFLILGSAYHPDFVVKGEGGEKDQLNLEQWSMLNDIVRNDIVLVPQQVLGQEFHGLTPDIKLAIRKILQISELSIRTGALKRTGAYVEVSKGARTVPKKQRKNAAALDEIKKMFKINLARFFLSETRNPKTGAKEEYAGVGTRNQQPGQQVWLRRLKHLRTSENTYDLFKIIIGSGKPFKHAKELVELALKNDTVAKSRGDRSRSPPLERGGEGATMGGKRRRKRKTRHKKKKTRSRKKTRKRRKRTKKRKKNKKKNKKKKKRTKRRR
jgi:hypothetical protein